MADRERGADAFRALFAHSMDAVLLTEPDGRIFMANPACTALFGYTEEELLRLGRDAIIDPSDPRLMPAIEERRRTGRFRGELTLKRKDGTQVEVELSSAIFRDDEGTQWTSMFVRDVTPRVMNERLLDGIFELLPVGVWIADRTGRIVRGNQAGQRIWAGARYVGPSRFGEYRAWWADTGRLIAAEEWALARALKHGETSIGEVLRIQCFDGTFKTIINSALPLRDHRGEFAGAIVVNEDITHLKEVEGTLRRTLESRAHVLEVVAHDLRNPLQVILMQAVFARRTLEETSDARARLDRISEQVNRMGRLIADLLDVSRIEAGVFQLECAPVDVGGLVREAIDTHRDLAAHSSIEIRGEVPEDLAHVFADRPRLMQVLDNLIANAVKFTPAGGRISIRAEAAEGPQVTFHVQDTGVGIEPGLLEHVFDRLWQARVDRRGIGLGLTIVKSVVEAHGGQVWVDSTVGLGTTFSFSLPTGGPCVPAPAG